MHFDWTFSVGNVVSVLGLGSAFLAAHMQNTKAAREQHRQNAAAAELQHVQNQKRLEHIETRLDMIYDWFIKRVVNRGMGED